MELFISNTVRIKCSFCQIDILRKNYKTHLDRKHPGKKDEGLCGYGQQTMSVMPEKVKRKYQSQSQKLGPVEKVSVSVSKIKFWSRTPLSHKGLDEEVMCYR